MVPPCTVDLNFTNNCGIEQPYMRLLTTCMSFEEMSIQVLFAFSAGLFGFICYWSTGVLLIFWILTLIRYILCKYFPPFHHLPCDTVIISCLCKTFYFDILVVCFGFCNLYFCCHVKKFIDSTSATKFSPLFSPRCL